MPLVDIDPRQLPGQCGQATGNLERDANVLAQAQMDLDALPGGVGEERNRETDTG